MSKNLSLVELKVEDIMTTNVHSIRTAMTVGQSIELMLKEKISGAPIVDQTGNVISVLSEGDLLRLTASDGLDKKIGSCLEKLTKTEKLLTVKRTDTCVDAYKIFLKNSVHRLIVCDSNGRIQGIVTRSNILKVLVGSHLEKAKPTPTDSANSDTTKPKVA